MARADKQLTRGDNVEDSATSTTRCGDRQTMATFLNLALSLVLLATQGFAVQDANLVSEPCNQHLQLYQDSASSQPWAMQRGQSPLPRYSRTGYVAGQNVRRVTASQPGDTNFLFKVMFDSWTKFPSGLLYGVFMDLGNYDECLSLTDISSQAGVFGGKYCLVSVAPTPESPEEADKMEKALKGRFPTTGHVGGAVPRSMPVSAGMSLTGAVCLPSSCSPADFMVYLNVNFSQTLQILPIPKLSFYTEENFCSDGTYDNFRPIDWGAVAFLIIFALFAVFSTAYDLLSQKSASRKEILLAFSWYTNGKKLFDTKKSAQDISCLHGIRFMSMVWVVICHRYSLNSGMPSTNSAEFSQQVVNWGYIFLQGGSLCVDTFFFLSGVLIAYVFLNSVHRGARFNIALFYFHRYIRLTPALAVIIFMYASLIKYTGSGPLWNLYSVSTCDKIWWKNLLYVNNYFDIEGPCVGQSWYLAADMQLYWLSPLVLIPLWKRPKIGRALLGFFTLVGLATCFGICYHYEIISVVKAFIENDREAALNYDLYYYYGTHTRFTPWLVGIALGYILHEIKKKSSGKITLSMVQWIALWCFAAFFMLVALCGVFPLDQMDHENNTIESTFFNTFHRPVWALGVGLMVLACSTGYGGPVNTFLSWSFFLPLSRLTYAIYLIHPTIQSITSLPMRTLLFNDDLTSICDTISDLVLSALIGIVFCLLFESPFIVLEKVVLGLIGVGKSSNRKDLQPSKLTATIEKQPDLEAATIRSKDPGDEPQHIKGAEAATVNNYENGTEGGHFLRKSLEVGDSVLNSSSTSNLLPH